jgi:hypothetical protein
METYIGASQYLETDDFLNIIILEDQVVKKIEELKIKHDALQTITTRIQNINGAIFTIDYYINSIDSKLAQNMKLYIDYINKYEHIFKISSLPSLMPSEYIHIFSYKKYLEDMMSYYQMEYDSLIVKKSELNKGYSDMIIEYNQMNIENAQIKENIKELNYTKNKFIMDIIGKYKTAIPAAKITKIAEMEEMISKMSAIIEIQNNKIEEHKHEIEVLKDAHSCEISDLGQYIIQLNSSLVFYESKKFTTYYKKKLCSFFNVGKCHRGSACTFAHYIEEIRK